jgi:hypothetical protein
MNKKIISIKNGLIWVGLSLILSLLTSCSSILNTSKIHHLTTNYCEPTIAYDYTLVNEESRLTTQQDSLLHLVLSPHNYFLSQTIGIENHITALLECEKDTLEALLTRQEINDRITLCLIEIDALAAELDCYAERLDQLSHYVDGINEKTQKRITILSVTLDAAATASAIFTANPYIAVGGGLASICLGALTISPKGKRVDIQHKRNLLRNIWYNDNSGKEFPHSIWLIINNPDFSNIPETSMREGLKERWMQLEFEGNIDNETEKLIFGNGGLYTASDLHDRAHMIKELEAMVNTLKQDLRSLRATLNTI